MTISADIEKAADFLKEGKLVAFPTETVYGLGGNALSDAAVAAIYAAKERPQFNPLIVHVSSLEEAKKYAEFNDHALALAKKFWPGPLTLVLPRRKDCMLSLLVSAGMDTVAIRMPAHPVAQKLLAAAQLPIAAPSANRSGRISPTEAAHVREELSGRVAMILDGGPCEVGIESTIVDCTGDTPEILRPGGLVIPAKAGIHSQSDFCLRENGGIKAPGMLASHYAPSKPLRLHATEAKPGEALLAFGANVPKAAMVENLSLRGDLQEAAANLFRMLRRLDASAAISIAAMPVPEEGLGIAINDRLKRAAAPRH
ncbi:MAG: threonylcarbamoyl-AMP synthase [Pseudomonadota bacterium]|nr:threonylcarbamoyl-AMP synthase [Pseudomonadota bacterium]